MPVYIALLRGINVGGNKIIKMNDLKTLYTSLGLRQVTTLLQSGNVLFIADNPNPAELSLQLEAAIVDRYGFDSKTILRTPEEWGAVIEQHPFSAEQMQDPGKVLVVFLQPPPDLPHAEAVIAAYTGSEKMWLRGNHLYVYYPDGMGKSKLDNAFIEKKLRLIGTARNWNTLQKVWASAQALSE